MQNVKSKFAEMQSKKEANKSQVDRESSNLKLNMAGDSFDNLYADVYKKTILEFTEQ